MALRPRLLAVSIAVALVAGVIGGWVLYRVLDDDGVPDDVVLSEPGEYQEPLDDSGRDPLPAGSAFPDVTLLDVSGAEVSTAELVGTPLVVNVWYTTCPPCARELPDFAAVHRELGDRVRFVGVNPIDDVEPMVDFAAERDVSYELLRDPDGSFLDAASVVSFPRTFLVDADGRIVDEHGEIDAAGLRGAIAEHLGVS